MEDQEYPETPTPPCDEDGCHRLAWCHECGKCYEHCECDQGEEEDDDEDL